MNHLMSYSLKYSVSLHIDKVITIFSSSDNNKFEPSDMQLNMLEFNQIQGIANPKYERKNDLHSYTYHIPMHYKNISELKVNLTPIQVFTILRQFVEGLLICEKHFLLSNRVILHPDLLFINDQLNHVFAIYVPIKMKFDISERDLIRNVVFQLVDRVGYWDSKAFSELFTFINRGEFSIPKLNTLLFLTIEKMLQTNNEKSSNNVIQLKVNKAKKRSLLNLITFILKKLFDIKIKNPIMKTPVKNELENVFPTTIITKQLTENTVRYCLSESNNNLVNEISLREGFSKLGRDTALCDIHLLFYNVSRIHLEFNLSNGKLQVRDLNSKNGTHLNNSRLTPNKWYSLIEGDMLQIADKVYYLRIQSLLLTNHNVGYN